MITDAIKIELVDVMGSDLSTVNSARVSFHKEVSMLDEKDVKLIDYLAEHSHTTPFRHNAIQLRCKAPIFLARQLGKHQAGLTWNEVSRRYVCSAPEFYTPSEWRSKPEGSIKQGSGTLAVDITAEDEQGDYDPYLDLIYAAESTYEFMLEKGVAPEMARMVLPQSMLTEWIWTGNLLAFAHIYNERYAETAQLEAQYFAEELDRVIRPAFPISWAALVDY
jgi:thymidylate synthase (FAD)